jgi:hypothetical protein
MRSLALPLLQIQRDSSSSQLAPYLVKLDFTGKEQLANNQTAASK